MKRMLSITLVMFIATFLVACNTDVSGNNENNIDVWSKQSTIKVMREIEYDDDFKNELAYNIKLAQNEYEGSHIIMTPELDVSYYDIQVAELKKEGSNDVIPLSNIEVFNQKYIEVQSALALHTTGVGWYPDALLPFEKAIEYEENVIEAGMNQGIYIEVYAEADQAPGIYTGTFKLTVDGKVFDIPVEVEVWDFELPKTPSFATNFSILETYVVQGELNATHEMYDAYVDALVKFRNAPYTLTRRGIDDYLDKVRYYFNPNNEELNVLMSTLSIPVERSGNGINAAAFTTYIDELVRISLEDNFNYLAKAQLRMGFIDEPHLNNTYDLVNSVSKHFHDTKNAIADRLEGEIENDVAIKNEMIESIRNIGNYITTVLNQVDDRLGPYTNHFAIHVSSAGVSARLRELHDNYGDENWWYTTNSNKPGYRIDADLLEARLNNWMAYDYNFIGDLFWESAKYSGNAGSIINPYETALRAPRDNGDGYLFYPGKAYDIFGPVSTVRMHAIRDGREEYEYLYYLESLYKDSGYEFDSLLAKVASRLYNNNTVNPNAEEFDMARNLVANLVLLAQKGIFVNDYKEVFDYAQLEVIETHTPIINNINGEQVNPSGHYEIQVPLNNSHNSLSFSTSEGETLNLYIGGTSKTLFDASSFDGLNIMSGESQADSVDGMDAIKITFDDIDNTTIKFDATRDVIDPNLDYLSFSIYNPHDKKMFLEVYFEGSGGESLAKDYVILPGYNTLYLPQIDKVRWDIIRNLTAVRFDFEAYQNESADLYIYSIKTVEGDK